MSRTVLVAVSIAAASVALSGGSFAGTSHGGAFAATQSQAAPPHDHAAPSESSDMMKMHQQMMSDMKAADEKLDQLVKTMNAAKGDARIDAIAEVVNELVSEHKAMRDRMGMMMMSGGGMMK